MSHEYLLWLTLFVYAWHIAEEMILGNIIYIQKVLKLKVWTANDLHVLSGLVLVCAFSSIMIGWKIPYLGLFLPAYYFVHGLLFHVLTTIRFRKISPGFFTTLFLGGYNLPFMTDAGFAFPGGGTVAMPHGAVVVTQLAVFLLKVFIVCSFQILIRWTLPRFRYDQLMAFGWKFLAPLALLNLLGTSLLVALRGA